jgi:hypothetical protein
VERCDRSFGRLGARRHRPVLVEIEAYYLSPASVTGARAVEEPNSRFFRPNPPPQIYIAEKTIGNCIIAAHHHPHPPIQGITVHEIGKGFSTAC